MKIRVSVAKDGETVLDKEQSVTSIDDHIQSIKAVFGEDVSINICVYSPEELYC